MNLIRRNVLPLSAVFLLSLAPAQVAFSQEGVPPATDKDAETVRFEAELRSLSDQSRNPMQDQAIAAQVYLFGISSPDIRQEIWREMEASGQQLAKKQEQDAEDAESLKNMDTSELDAETLRYKAAVEQLDLPPGMAEDLVEMFQANNAEFRKTLWQRVEESPLKK